MPPHKDRIRDAGVEPDPHIGFWRALAGSMAILATIALLLILF